MVKSFLIVLFALITSVSVGQFMDFDDPVKLPGAVNSEDEETTPLLSSDGKTLFFSRILHNGNAGGKYSGADIWSSTWGKGAWTKASRNEFTFNNKDNATVAGLSRDGKTLYLMKSSASKKLSAFYFSKKTGKTWSDPEMVPLGELDSQGFTGFYVSPDFDVVFLSLDAPGGRGKEDLYVSTKRPDDTWTYPKNLGAAVNTSGFEISPFLSADKKRLYFSSNGHAGQGDADVYMCERLFDSWDQWSAPKNLGPKINSQGFDANFSIYGDTIAYFTSNRGKRTSDIYTAKVLEVNEVIAMGQRYLTVDEMNKLLGSSAVSRKIVFEKGATDVSPASKELIYYIVNKLINESDINVQLIPLEEDNPQQTAKRVAAIVAQLKQEGLEAFRILPRDTRPKKTIKTSTGGVIELLFFE